MHLSRLLAPALLVLALLPTAHAQTSISLGLRLGLNAASRSGENPTNQLNDYNGIPYPNTVQDYQRKMLLAPQFGAVAEVRFGRLAVQPAVLFSQKGVDQQLIITSKLSYSSSSPYNSNTSYHTVSRPNYLEIPINIVFTSGGNQGFQLFAGPYMGFGMGGRAEYESSGYGSLTGSNTNTFSYGSWKYSNTLVIYKDAYPGPPAAVFQVTGGNSTLEPTPFSASSGYAVARRFDAGLNVGVGYRQGPLQVQLGYGLGLINQQPAKALDQRDDLPAYYQRVAQLTATYFVKVK